MIRIFVFIFLKGFMIKLKENEGIPRNILLMMSIVSGLTVANLYYNQPLLEEMRASLRINEVEANFITVITQIGYALGLLLIVPMADKCSRRKIVTTCMTIAMLMALVIALASNVWLVWGASIIIGACSVVPQIFVPMAGQFSRPEHKSRNMGFVLSGLLTGILAARVIGGYLGGWLGWRLMFGLVAFIMLLSLLVSLRMMPVMQSSFKGSYHSLIATIGKIYVAHPRMRNYSLRAAFGFGSMMSIWSCMAFHLADAPFHAGSDKVGMLGLCGIAGAMAASGVGKYIPRYGIDKISSLGHLLQIIAWLVAYFLSDTYIGLILAIILVDIGAQCLQLSNQSGCLKEVPDATNRANTIFMTTLFIGGSIGTFCAGVAWERMGWLGVCATGLAFALCSVITTWVISKSAQR